MQLSPDKILFPLLWSALAVAAFAQTPAAAPGEPVQVQIQRQLDANPSLRGVTVDVSANTVTLNGTVTSLQAKSVAEGIAHQLAPTLSMSDNISVNPASTNTPPGQPPAPADATLVAQQIQQQLQSVTALADVVATPGARRITLSGAVLTPADKHHAVQIAQQLAQGLPIEDHIVAQEGARRPRNPAVNTGGAQLQNTLGATNATSSAQPAANAGSFPPPVGFMHEAFASHPELAGVTFVLLNNDLTLAGTVRSDTDRRRAVALARRAAPHARIHDHIRVVH